MLGIVIGATVTTLAYQIAVLYYRHITKCKQTRYNLACVYLTHLSKGVSPQDSFSLASDMVLAEEDIDGQVRLTQLHRSLYTDDYDKVVNTALEHGCPSQYLK